MTSTLQSIPISRRLSTSSQSLLLSDDQDERRSPSPSFNSTRNYHSDNEVDQLVLDPNDAFVNPTIQNRTPPTIVINHHSLCRHSNQTVERMRRRLRFFFMNPIEKWQAKRRFPWKLLLQLVKIIIVTLQVLFFGSASYSHINFFQGNAISLRHLFLSKWDDARDVNVYPPSEGFYSVYTENSFYDNVDFVVKNYARLDRAIGPYSYSDIDGEISKMRFCKYYYKTGRIESFNQTYSFDSTILEDCLPIHPLGTLNVSGWDDYKTKEYFAANNFSVHFQSLVKAELTFSLKTVLLSDKQSPDCFRLDVTVLYDNSDHDGQLKISLQMKPHLQVCHGSSEYHDSKTATRNLFYLLDILVITICCLSFVLCLRALFRGQRLRKISEAFFENYYGKTLTFSEKMEFLNCWYVIIVINDVLIVVGSIIKMQIESKTTEEDMYIACTSLLGIGMLLVWFGVLRYLIFFHKYNIVMLTLQRATPDILRFLICAVLIYAGFTFNGWIVLGPYHLKFSTLSTTSECLFSLINGDDMFASFATTAEKPVWIWWYSRVYFYSFISLFIYIILSLFIAVIMDAYDTIKTFHQQGFPKSDLMKFVAECVDDASSGLFRERSGTKWYDVLSTVALCTCCGRKNDFDCYEPI